MNPTIEFTLAVIAMALLAALLVRIVRNRRKRTGPHQGLTHLPARTGLPGMGRYE